MSNVNALLNIASESTKAAEFFNSAMNPEQSAEWNTAVESASRGFIETGYAIDRCYSAMKDAAGDEFEDSEAGKMASDLRRAARDLNAQVNQRTIEALRVAYAIKWGFEIPAFDGGASASVPHSIAKYAP